MSPLLCVSVLAILLHISSGALCEQRYKQYYVAYGDFASRDITCGQYSLVFAGVDNFEDQQQILDYMSTCFSDRLIAKYFLGLNSGGNECAILSPLLSEWTFADICYSQAAPLLCSQADYVELESSTTTTTTTTATSYPLTSIIIDSTTTTTTTSTATVNFSVSVDASTEFLNAVSSDVSSTTTTRTFFDGLRTVTEVDVIVVTQSLTLIDGVVQTVTLTVTNTCPPDNAATAVCPCLRTAQPNDYVYISQPVRGSQASCACSRLGLELAVVNPGSVRRALNRINSCGSEGRAWVASKNMNQCSEIGQSGQSTRPCNTFSPVLCQVPAGPPVRRDISALPCNNRIRRGRDSFSDVKDARNFATCGISSTPVFFTVDGVFSYQSMAEICGTYGAYPAEIQPEDSGIIIAFYQQCYIEGVYIFVASYGGVTPPPGGCIKAFGIGEFYIILNYESCNAYQNILCMFSSPEPSLSVGTMASATFTSTTTSSVTTTFISTEIIVDTRTDSIITSITDTLTFVSISLSTSLTGSPTDTVSTTIIISLSAPTTTVSATTSVTETLITRFPYETDTIFSVSDTAVIVTTKTITVDTVTEVVSVYKKV